MVKIGYVLLDERTKRLHIPYIFTNKRDAQRAKTAQSTDLVELVIRQVILRT